MCKCVSIDFWVLTCAVNSIVCIHMCIYIYKWVSIIYTYNYIVITDPIGQSLQVQELTFNWEVAFSSLSFFRWVLGESLEANEAALAVALKPIFPDDAASFFSIFLSSFSIFLACFALYSGSSKKKGRRKERKKKAIKKLFCFLDFEWLFLSSLSM